DAQQAGGPHLLRVGELDGDAPRADRARRVRHDVAAGEQGAVAADGERRRGGDLTRGKFHEDTGDGVTVALLYRAEVQPRGELTVAEPRARLLQLLPQARDAGPVPLRLGGGQRLLQLGDADL